MTPSELDTLDSLLPRGYENATSIPELSRMLGWSDRAVRECIEELVNTERVPVVTLPRNPGVFVAVSPEELDLGDSHLRSKAMALLHRRRSLRLCRERLAWSPTLFDT